MKTLGTLIITGGLPHYALKTDEDVYILGPVGSVEIDESLVGKTVVVSWEPDEDGKTHGFEIEGSE
jgi:hypothetical protein